MNGCTWPTAAYHDQPLPTVDSTGERNTLKHMEECSHEAETADLLFRQPEGTDVGAIAARRFASKDCPAVRP
jgi:hypothetical protein